ncbi:MAG: phosphotransferase [Oscillospiraceae bacterium]|nr:phosphotransferase [Oscillospiraceae bacterium]
MEGRRAYTETELKIVAGSLGISGDTVRGIAPFICEEDGNEYEVWLVDTGNNRYVLKKAKGLETECYTGFFREGKSYAPAFLGSAEYEGDKFILLEYCQGETLRLSDPEMLMKAVDALSAMQNDYWQRDDLSGCAVTMERAMRSVEGRGRYLGSEILEQAYALFMDVYKKVPRTLCHEDLLPINVLVGDRAVLIDWEYGGILPYLSSFSRLIAHGRDDENAYFYMKKEDREKAVSYFYEKMVSNHGISREEYLRDLEHFLFYEYCEWVMLGNRYGSTDDERYGYYLKKAEETAAKLLGMS